MALPRDSYLQSYFQDVMNVMRVGPPLYFVVTLSRYTALLQPLLAP